MLDVYTCYFIFLLLTPHFEWSMIIPGAERNSAERILLGIDRT